jgi:hypothetical protein
VFDALPDELSTSSIRFSFILLWLADGRRPGSGRNSAAPFLDDEEPDDLGFVLTATLTLPNWPTPTRIGVVCGTRDGAFSRR